MKKNSVGRKLLLKGDIPFHECSYFIFVFPWNLILPQFFFDSDLLNQIFQTNHNSLNNFDDKIDFQIEKISSQ